MKPRQALRAPSSGEAGLALVADGEHLDPIDQGHHPVEGHVARTAARDDQLPQVTTDPSADEGMPSENADCIDDLLGCPASARRVLRQQEAEQPIEIAQGTSAVGNRAHPAISGGACA